MPLAAINMQWRVAYRMKNGTRTVVTVQQVGLMKNDICMPSVWHRITSKICSSMATADFWTNKYMAGFQIWNSAFFVSFREVNYLWSHFVTALGLLVWFWFWGEGVGELLGYFGVGDSDDVCCGGGEAEEVDVAVPHN